MKTKKIFGYLFIVTFGLLNFISCTDDITKATVKSSVTANELNAPAASSYVLTLANKDNNFETFTWAAPDFGFKSAVSYKLQMDKASGNFATPVEVASVTNGATTASITVGAMNDKLLGLGLTPQTSSGIKLRVVSTVNDKITPVISSEKTISVTPYATIFPSIWGMGDALNGWGPWPTAAIEVPSSEYKKYSTMAYLINGKIFRFFEQQDWGPTAYNYEYFTTVDSKFSNDGGGDKNFKVLAATGWYTLTLDLVAKTFTATATTEPALYMTGDALNGWGWNPGQYVKLKFIKPGVFEATPTWSVQTFRFFAQPDWSPTGYNYPFFTSVDSKFENANDGDKNLRYIGTPGAYKIRVDLNAKTVVH